MLAWREGWSPILSNLKTFLETGTPMSLETPSPIDWETTASGD